MYRILSLMAAMLVGISAPAQTLIDSIGALKTINYGQEVTLDFPVRVIGIDDERLFVTDGKSCISLSCSPANCSGLKTGSYIKGYTGIYDKGIKNPHIWGDKEQTLQVCASGPRPVSPVEITLKKTWTNYVNRYLKIADVDIVNRPSTISNSYYSYYLKSGTTYVPMIFGRDVADKTVPQSSVTVYGRYDDGIGSDRCFYVYSINEDAANKGVVPSRQFAISVASNDETLGHVSIGSEGAKSLTVNEGTSVTLNAVPETGCSFSEWTLDGVKVSGEATYTFTPEASGNYVGVFKKEAGGESVTRRVYVSSSNPAKGSAAIEGTDAMQIYTADPVTVVATPLTADDYFVKWTDENGVEKSTSSRFTYTDKESVALVGHFKSRYSITVIQPDNGTITVKDSEGKDVSSGTMLSEGTQLTVEVTAREGYKVGQLYVNDVPSTLGDDGKTTVTVSCNTVVRATIEYKVAGRFTVRLSVEDPAMGIAYFSEEGETVVSIEAGQSVTIHAVANNGFKFVGWRFGGGSIRNTDAVTKVTPSGDVEIIAVFDYVIETPRRVEVRSSDPTRGTVSIEGEESTVVTTRKYLTLVAQPKTDNDTFIDWTDQDNRVVSTERRFVYRSPLAAVLTANFSGGCAVRYSCNDGGTVTVFDMEGNEKASGSLFSVNDKIEIVVKPSEHFELQQLMVNDRDMTETYLYSTDPFIIKIDTNIDIKVKFGPRRYWLVIGNPVHGVIQVYDEIDAVTERPAGQRIYTDTKVAYGSYIYIFLVPDDGYSPKVLYVNGEPVNSVTEKCIRMRMEGATTLGATFEKVTAIDSIGEDGLSDILSDPDARIYTLEGHRVSPPLPPGLYLVRWKGGCRVVKR